MTSIETEQHRERRRRGGGAEFIHLDVTDSIVTWIAVARVVVAKKEIYPLPSPRKTKKPRQMEDSGWLLEVEQVEECQSNDG